MEKIVEQNLLFDFYGDLLTKRQRRIYADAVVNDLSQSEIAYNEGVSRQCMHDMIKRSEEALRKYEESMHLVRNFLRLRDQAREIKRLCADDCADEGRFKKIDAIASDILEEL